jgi:hypothetical protein
MVGSRRALQRNAWQTGNADIQYRMSSERICIIKLMDCRSLLRSEGDEGSISGGESPRRKRNFLEKNGERWLNGVGGL